MGFSSRLKAHKNILTLETLKFIVEYLEDGNATQAALRSGIPQTYAGRQGAWLKKHPIVKAALEKDLDEDEIKQLKRIIKQIESQISVCKDLLGLKS